MEYILEFIRWLGFSALIVSPLIFLVTVFWSWRLFTFEDFIVSIALSLLYIALVIGVLFSSSVYIVSVVIGVVILIGAIVELISRFKE